MQPGDHVSIDAAALAHFLCLASSGDLLSIVDDDGLGTLDRQFGGEYAELCDRVRCFFMRLQSSGIKSTFVLDGNKSALKHGTHLSRRESLISECKHA